MVAARWSCIQHFDGVSLLILLSMLETVVSVTSFERGN